MAELGADSNAISAGFSGGNDWLGLLVTLIAAKVVVDGIGLLAERGLLDSRDARKINHVGAFIQVGVWLCAAAATCLLQWPSGAVTLAVIGSGNCCVACTWISVMPQCVMCVMCGRR
jgi:hypothetical protein